ncbi:hypothetical protein HAX54_048808 [Datura stramonium]|uniref:Uncharacterized protein n=1 Tax=Datura stramonium TaxID=4076 RepID=A0ABS8WPE7_DATST|nr:hypothetical protein [Datura stramonium]
MLDLSSNAFIAELPTSLFQNLKAMRRLDQTMKAPGNDGLALVSSFGRLWEVTGLPSTNNTTFVPDEESDSTFLSELSWKVVLMGYEEEEIMVSRQVPGPTIFNSKTLRHAMTGEM